MRLGSRDLVGCCGALYVSGGLVEEVRLGGGILVLCALLVGNVRREERKGAGSGLRAMPFQGVNRAVGP